MLDLSQQLDEDEGVAGQAVDLEPVGRCKQEAG